MALPHTPPYTPRGRGKIERFFRSVRDEFLTGRERSSLDKLNADLSVWINQYHQRNHSTLGMSPLERKLKDTGPALKQISPTQNIDDIFRMEQLKRVGPDGCVRMFSKRFEIPDALPGSQVVICYLPWDETHITVGGSRDIIKPLDTIKNALRYEKPRRKANTDKQEMQK
ncbi:MAG: integrase core domain-containing protein [Chitinispirillaceae bacterium]